MLKSSNQPGNRNGSGGRRPGAGRKKGSKTKIKVEVQSLADRINALVENGLTPIELQLAIMRDEALPLDVRLEASRLAGPYIHRRQPQDVTVDALIYTPPPVVLVHTAPPEFDESLN